LTYAPEHFGRLGSTDYLDLAFLLVTHNFDATPIGDHVEVRINGSIYLVTPNAGKAGLADIALA
jgi:hypothetical protein